VSIFVDKEAMHCPKIKCESCSFVNEKLSNFEKMCDDVKTMKRELNMLRFTFMP
jgi:hypothetical protein